ncbi:MAG TPA: hypothetical protein VF781_08460 [Solirubrobacteraceae bacterium]
MSSLALPREAVPGRARGRLLAQTITDHGYEIVLAAPIAILAAVMLIQLPHALSVDSWLALLTGRVVWQSGLPHHETLTVIAHGVAWIDQQWLAQLASYGLYRLGGLGLLGLVNVILLAGSVGFATFAARRLGAPFLSILAALPLCLVMIAPSREVRTQTLILPLFVLLAYLLADDSRRPSARVFWCLPILVLWANLHGTVTMGAGLVALRALTVLIERRDELQHRLRAWTRPAALLAGSAVAILLTPYGLPMAGYYRSTLLSSTLRHAVTEWQPVTSQPLTAAALLIVAGLALWSFGRLPRQTTPWDKLALIILAVGAVSVVRNALFFGLFALMVLPVTLGWDTRSGAPAGKADRQLLINSTITLLAIGLLLLAAAVTLSRPTSGLEYQFQRPGVLSAVQRATRANPALRVTAEPRFTDWLLWRDPALAGRIAYDARYELLSAAQLGRLEALFSQSGPDWKRGAHGYGLIVLSRTYDPGAFAAFKAEPGARVLYNDGQRLVVLRSPQETRS